MRYLSTLSLALIVHVLLSIGVLMALACTATPTATPTPTGPMYSEEEAIAMLKEHLQAKPVPIPGYPFRCFSYIGGESATWSAKYDNEGHRWDVRADSFIDNPLVGTSASPSPSGAGSFIDKLVGTPNPSAAGAWAESLFAGTPQPQSVPRESVPRAYSWSVYERTKSILATGDDPLNQFC